MEYTIGSAPELTLELLRAFTPHPAQEPVRAQLQRFLWNSANFGTALPLKEAAASIQSNAAGAFVYHQKSSLVFRHVAAGTHQLLMAYLEALHKTDFVAPMSEWTYNEAYSFNATAKLADDFIDEGHGFYLSSVAKAHTLLVSKGFAWTVLERKVFQDFAYKSPRG